MVEVSEKNVYLNIPFSSPEHASLAYDVMVVDKELKGSGVHRELSIQQETLVVKFYGVDLKKLRVAVNAFLKNILLVVKTINLFH